MKLSKSKDGGISFTPWHYIVSFPFECRDIFKTDYIQRPFEVNTIVCNTYDILIPTLTNETVSKELTL